MKTKYVVLTAIGWHVGSDRPACRLGNELGKVGSPRLGSEAVDAHDGSPKPPPKGKGKMKAKKSGTPHPLRSLLRHAL